MIKISVYEDVDCAKKVYLAYYNMISGKIGFSDETVWKAIKDNFQEEYKKDLPISINSPNQGSINETEVRTKIKQYKSLYDFLYKDEKGNEHEKVIEKKLGLLLCGYMDDKRLKDLIIRFQNENKGIKESVCYGNDNTKKNLSSVNRKQAVTNKDDKFTELKGIFCYDKIVNTKSKREFIYDFISSLNTQTCPYCNRNYITVVEVKDFKTRPQLDHFYCKSAYPFLAVSMRNLIPSCSVCNLAKHYKDLEILYPYKEGAGDDFVFTIESQKDISYILNLDNTNFRIRINENMRHTSFEEDGEREHLKRCRESKKMFGWDETYTASCKKYAQSVLHNYYVFNKTYRDCIVNAMPSVFHNSEEIVQLLNPKLRYSEDYNDEPLSKLTRDIIEWGIPILDED